MAYEQRDNEGAVWPNDRKENDRQPDWTGKAMIGGVMYWVSMWTKTGPKGEFFSFALKPQDDQQAPRDNGDQRRHAPRQQSYADARGGGSRARRPQGPPRQGPFGGDEPGQYDENDSPF